MSETQAPYGPYPEDTSRTPFDEEVLKGIFVEVPLEPSGYEKRVKSQYGSFSSEKLRRLYEEWKKDPAIFIETRPHHQVKAMLRFEKDYEADLKQEELEWALWETKKNLYLPEPQPWYFWVRVLSQNFERSEEVARFRLWHPKLGDVPDRYNMFWKVRCYLSTAS